MNFGATLTDLIEKKSSINVVLGFSDPKEYILDNKPRFGVICGRYANRIAGGQFKLDNQQYSLEMNNFPNGLGCHLHGGLKGFDKQLFTLKSVEPNKVLL